jgi:uncharacterized protein YbaR (Trm112 family)
MKCPNCGANLDFKVGERDIVCKSCRRKFAIEYGVDDLSKLSEKATEALRWMRLREKLISRMSALAM